MHDIKEVVWPSTPAVGTRHGCLYLYKAFGNPAKIISTAFEALEKVEFDTMVCTGTSGLLVAPILARAMGRHLLVVRKPTELCHSLDQCEGTLGRKWLFVDDCIATGATLARVAHAVRHLTEPVAEYVGAFLYDSYANYFNTDWNHYVEVWDKEDFDPSKVVITVRIVP